MTICICYHKFLITKFNNIMTNNTYSGSSILDPETGFVQAPSASQAANDLRAAIEEKGNSFISTATNIKDKAVEKAAQFREITTEKAAILKDKASDQWQETRVKVSEYHNTAEDYIREHPTKCVVGALGLGFIIGLIVRR
jgi:ElaB/YqjD/DUF883 family membrane-anchored ribosome-binding protein